MNELTETYNICLNLIKDHMNWDDEKATIWMNTENPLLGGTTPLNMIVKGRGEKLLKIVNSLIDESKGPNE